MTLTTIDAPWLTSSSLQQLLAALSDGGEEARIVGGAVRNTVLGHPVTDIDVATTTRAGGDRAPRRGGRASGPCRPASNTARSPS